MNYPRSSFLAHRTPDGREQTVAEHLRRTAEQAACDASFFGAETLAKLAGLTHDLGKYSLEFQERLQGKAQTVDHSTAGMAECCKQGAISVALAVAGHHAGLPDGGGQGDGPDASTLLGRICRAQMGKLPSYEAWQREISLPKVEDPLPKMEKKEGIFFTRMLFSCLVDGDYTDTAAFMDRVDSHPPADSIEELWLRLQAYIAPWFPPKGKLNTQRCAVLEQCQSQGEACPPGLFTLTVPTGGGKTVSSLAFALAHAKSQGLRRVVYVIPYTSIIEQTAQTFRNILGEENVLEHHSQVETITSSETSTEWDRACETWDKPVIVTTAVQFFESLFSCRPTQCRKLHNLAKSVIIFDEAQMLPLPYLRPCVWAISQLVKGYGASAVLCTATQPALEPLFREFLPGKILTEICPASAIVPDIFRRVTFRREGKLTTPVLSQQLQEHTQALCIVNSRKIAQDVYHSLHGEGNYCLSTLLVPAHRRKLLEEIRRRLREGLHCRVISTSLIEAGVDVDFPTVYRELCGLDSLLQAAGRCNREGKRPFTESVVTLFQSENKVPALFETATDCAKEILDQHEDFSTAQAIHAYFSLLLYRRGTAAQDTQGILSLMEREPFPFRKIAENFHLIDSPTRTIYIPLEAGEALIQRLRMGEKNRQLFRSLGQYGVPVYEPHLQALEMAGALEHLEGNLLVLRDLTLYSEETGLALDVTSGNALFL